MEKIKVLQPGMFMDHEIGGDWVFNRGLNENECEVEKFDYPTYINQHGIDKMRQKLVELSEGKDLIFIGKGQPFDAKTLAK